MPPPLGTSGLGSIPRSFSAPLAATTLIVAGCGGPRTSPASNAPLAVVTLPNVPVAPSGPAPDIVGISLDGVVPLAWRSDGTVWAWTEWNGVQQTLTSREETPEGVVQLVSTSTVACVRTRADGRVLCWRAAERLDLAPPEPVPGIDDAVGLAAARDGTCALLADGTARCWDHLPWSPQWRATAPTSVPGLADAVALGGGSQMLCAVRRNGTVACIGEDRPPSAEASPRMDLGTLPGFSDATAVAVAPGQRCALRRDGTVVCWGSASGAPFMVPGIAGAVALGCAGQWRYARIRAERAPPPPMVPRGFGCALVPAEGLRCWRAGDRAASWEPLEGSAPLRGFAMGTLGFEREGMACGWTDASEVRCWVLDDGPGTRRIDLGAPGLKTVRECTPPGRSPLVSPEGEDFARRLGEDQVLHVWRGACNAAAARGECLPARCAELGVGADAGP